MIKNFFLAVILVVMLSFSMPNNTYLFSLNQKRAAITYNINARNDSYTNGYIKNNEKRKFEIIVSLYIQVRIIDYSENYFNTS
jgi:hypothetical protein